MEKRKFLIKEFSNTNKKIVFFGAIHSNDIGQILRIEKEINQLNPEIILLEGGYDKSNYKTKEEAISKGNEMGITSYIADIKNIKKMSNDPPEEEQIEFIEKKFGRELCFFYFVIRDLSSTNKSSFNLLSSKLIDDFRKKSNWRGFDYSLDKIKSLFKETFETEFNLKENLIEHFNPNLNLSELNIISKMLTDFRDDYMINLLKKLLLKCNLIFIIKGKSHLESREAQIEMVLK